MKPQPNTEQIRQSRYWIALRSSPTYASQGYNETGQRMQLNSVSEITRRNILDELRLRNIFWSGRLGEVDFLNRIFPLDSLPSNDSRQRTMAGDIAMHRERFVDWPEDWVFDDSRLNLLWCPDEKFLRFLCEMVHPVVRFNSDEAKLLMNIFNKHLTADGYEIVPVTYISGKPVFSARLKLAFENSGIEAAKKVADVLTSDHISSQITRMEASIEADPMLAIGTAKEFLETICKGILAEHGIALSGAENIQQLTKMAREALALVIDQDVDETLRKTLNSLATVTQGIAELRGQLGSGHGHHPATRRPRPEIARLAVGAATTLGVFLFETHRSHLSAVGRSQG